MRYKINTCKHFGVCGGCRHRDMIYSKQLKKKKKKITDALSHIAHPAIKPILGSPVIDYYRNKMEFAFGIWDDEQVLGLRERNKYYHVIDVKKCYLQSPLSDTIRKVVREAAKKSKIKAFHRKKLTGVLRYLVIREGKNTGHCMVNLITSPVKENRLKRIFTALRNECPEVTTCIWSVTDSPSDVAYGEKSTVMWGNGFIKEKIGHITCRISPYSFFQTNSRGTELLYDTIKKYVRKAPRDILLDIYCGGGGIGMYLSDLFNMVIGLDANASAVHDAQVNMNINNIKNYQVMCTKADDIKQHKTTFLFSGVTAIVDPPRPGLSSDLIDFLIDKKPPVLLYISCNPDALRRDLQRLNQYYKITAIQPIDLFPHTPHIETVIVLKARAKKAKK